MYLNRIKNWVFDLDNTLYSPEVEIFSQIDKRMTEFIKNKLKKKYDTIIIDEASMVDINLFLELIQSIPNGSNIILVGDADQLPPIGPGQPFKDMIESKKVNISKLSGNFKYPTPEICPLCQ